MILFSSLFMVFRLDFVDILSCKRCNFKLLCKMKKKQIEGVGDCNVYTLHCTVCTLHCTVASRRVYIAITSQLQYFCTNGMHICFVLIVLKKNYVCTYINVREDLFLMITINFYRNLYV